MKSSVKNAPAVRVVSQVEKVVAAFAPRPSATLYDLVEPTVTNLTDKSYFHQIACNAFLDTKRNYDSRKVPDHYRTLTNFTDNETLWKYYTENKDKTIHTPYFDFTLVDCIGSKGVNPIFKYDAAALYYYIFKMTPNNPDSPAVSPATDDTPPICPDKMYYPKSEKYYSAEQTVDGLERLMTVTETEMERFQTLLNKKTLDKNDTRVVTASLRNRAKFLLKHENLLDEVKTLLYGEKEKMAELSRILTL